MNFIISLTLSQNTDAKSFYSEKRADIIHEQTIKCFVWTISANFGEYFEKKFYPYTDLFSLVSQTKLVFVTKNLPLTPMRNCILSRYIVSSTNLLGISFLKKSSYWKSQSRDIGFEINALRSHKITDFSTWQMNSAKIM